MAKQEPFNPKKLESLQKEAGMLETRLASSPTAYTQKTTPTGADLSLDAKLEKARSAIEQLKSQRLREQWYGPEKEGEEVPPEKEGLISRSLGALGAPLYAIAGGAEWALGKGTKKGLLENINANIKEREAFGSLLGKVGAPKIVSLPLGFALDVMFDPVNWATAGSAALIPRIGMGFAKGVTKGGIKAGLETAKVGATSGLQSKARTIMPFLAPSKTIGWAGKKLGTSTAIGKTIAGGSEKYRNLMENVGKKAIIGSEKYDVLMGTNIYDKLGKGIFGISDINKGKTLGATIEKGIRQMPAIGIGKIKISGDDLVDFFKYSPSERAKITRLEDTVQTLGLKQGYIMADPIKVEAGKKIFDSDVFASIDDIVKKEGTGAVKKNITDNMKKAVSAAEEAKDKLFKVENNLENAKKILEIAGQDYNLKHLVKTYEEIPLGKTGVKWYDKWLDKQRAKTGGEILEKYKLSGLAKKMGIFDKVKDWTPLNKLINANDEYLKIFKWAKVPANPASHVYAVGGNTLFGWMGGMPVDDPRLVKFIKDNYQFLRGKRGFDFLKKNFFNDTNTWLGMIENDPKLFKMIFGLSPEAIVGKIPAGRKINLDEVLKRINPELTIDDVVKSMTELRSNVMRNLDEAVAAETKTGKTIDEILKQKEIAVKSKQSPTGSQTLREVAEKGGGVVRSYDIPSGWAATEIGGAPGELLEKAKGWAANKDKGGASRWIANKILNTMPEHYEFIDQSFKLGYAQYSTIIGLEESSLLKLSRLLPINKNDLLEPVVEGGKKLYRLTPQKAAEASAELFMNYAAMPDYVKILRSLPIIGSPFFSFQAAMLAKTGKTLIHNPAIFNKISLLMNEISGARTPTEKAALEEKYNTFLKSPSVVRLSKNWNIDIKNLIPYLTMNMLNPSQRKYSDTLPGVVSNVIDNSPFMKHPVGQVILDYIILPSILSEAERPQGQFGQPLYPGGATLGQKTFYAGRSLAETAIPGVAAYAGLTQPLLKGVGMPDEAIKFYPSYGWRQIAEATRGKSTIGALTKEEPLQKTMRALSARSGLPFYPLKTEYITNKNQKNK